MVSVAETNSKQKQYSKSRRTDMFVFRGTSPTTCSYPKLFRPLFIDPPMFFFLGGGGDETRLIGPIVQLPHGHMYCTMIMVCDINDFYDRNRDSTNILLLFPHISLKSIAKAENLDFSLLKGPQPY